MENKVAIEGQSKMKPMGKAHTEKSGFSLIEVLLTILVLSVVAMAAVPYTLGWRIALRASTVATTLSSDLLGARRMAITVGADVIVSFELTDNTYRVYVDRDGSGVVLSNLTKTVPLNDIAAGVRFGYNPGKGIDGNAITAAVKMGGTSSPIRVTFRPDGQIVNGGTVYLIPSMDLGNMDNRQRAVNASVAGKISTWRYNSDGSPGPWMEYM
jgi:prepilin-type N-terminal cleavage/methylation domain-containing protein